MGFKKPLTKKKKKRSSTKGRKTNRMQMDRKRAGCKKGKSKKETHKTRGKKKEQADKFKERNKTMIKTVTRTYLLHDSIFEEDVVYECICKK